MRFAALAAIGLAAGIVTGMGIGGGAILIPCLVFFAGIEQQTAQGINLLYFIPTAAIALISHLKNKKIDREMAKSLVYYGLAGAVLGAAAALAIKPEALRRMFGYFLLAAGMYELLRKDNTSIKK